MTHSRCRQWRRACLLLACVIFAAATVRPENVREVAPTVANTDHDPLLAEFWDSPVSYAWQTPYRVDIGAVTNPGRNRLQMRVANPCGWKQDSATVLRQLLFWLRLLAEGHEEWTLETGGTPLRISVMPAISETEVGIALDHVQIKALVDEAPEGELSNVMDTAEFGEEDEKREGEPPEEEEAVS